MYGRADHLPTFVYDAFPAAAVGGNPAGVVLLERPAPGERMQQVAADLDAPTTGFVDLPSARAGAAAVRFFTPRQEIDACGHVTVAIATCLEEVGVWRAGGTADPAVVAAGGRFPVRLHRRDGRILVEMRHRLATGVTSPTGLDPKPVVGQARLSNLLPMMRAGTGLRHLCIPVAAVEDLPRLPLKPAGIVALSEQARVDTIGVFAVAGTDHATLQVRMRDLCARIGAVEEPASGTTCATLAFCLADRGWLDPTRPQLEIVMGVEMGRPSRLLVRLHFDGHRPRLASLYGNARRVTGQVQRPSTHLPEPAVAQDG